MNETDFINTVDEDLELYKLVNHPNIFVVRCLYMNIEEKMIESSERASNKIFLSYLLKMIERGTGTLNFEIF